ncbi:MAG: CPBP family intramembrane metalloprotease [Clostridiales bacterium]|nr:CPBP family intramembrane metalloprotease [Clostridiales bacterium]
MDAVDAKPVDKKRLIVYIAIAYCVSFLMMIPMYIGKQKGLDLTQIVNAQMCSPAAAVALGFLLFCKGEKRVPKMFMVVLVVNYVIQLVLGLLSVFANPFGPDDVIDLAKLLGSSGDSSQITGVSTALQLSQIYMYIGQYVLIIASVLLWIGYFAARKEGRKFAGLSRNNEGKGLFLIFLFVVLYLLRNIGPLMLDGVIRGNLNVYLSEYAALVKNPMFTLSVISLFINYPLTIIAFLGEEYGWRYFLMPIMQKKFGMKLGVILLGIVWGLWHLPVDTMFYTNDSVPQMIVGQMITCVFIGIFFGYAYLKTNNIWVPVAMHFLNNNLIPIITGTFTADVMQNQHIEWLYLIEVFVLDFIFFGLFIFAKEYRGRKKAKEAIDA